ncbi:MAG: DNA repair protein RadA [Patescibacteria group bacterium]
MSEPKTLFSCSKCEAQYPKWSGRCLECGGWGTIHESINHGTDKTKNTTIKFDEKKLIDFNNISSDSFSRIKLELKELNQIFGGGIVKGSLTLLGGEPGIGKSTLILQIFQGLDRNDSPLLYISGEESAQQIKLRLDRLNYKTKNLKFVTETNVEEICNAISTLKPQLAVIDSIQTLYSNDSEGEAGSISQIRTCTVKLLQAAKSTGTALIITGHVTKDGSVAGPKTLEHLVDVVIYMEGDKLHGYRILRSAKNRFGSTDEIGILEMTEKGLMEVADPSKIFLTDTGQNISGGVISCFMEGSRAFLVEVQALVTPTVFGFPQRKTSGYSVNRLQMICAVLFKRAGLNLSNQDIHLNIVGGFKVNEPAIDLAVAMAIFSALKNIIPPKNSLAIGEIGLGGEVRPAGSMDKRITEAEKLGFQTVFAPKLNLNKKSSLNHRQINNVNQLAELLNN